MTFTTDKIRHAYFQGANGIGLTLAMRPVFKTVQEGSSTLEVQTGGVLETRKVWGRVQYIDGYAIGAALTSREDQGSKLGGREIAERRLAAILDEKGAGPGHFFFATIEELDGFLEQLRKIEADNESEEKLYRQYHRVWSGQRPKNINVQTPKAVPNGAGRVLLTKPPSGPPSQAPTGLNYAAILEAIKKERMQHEHEQKPRLLPRTPWSR